MVSSGWTQLIALAVSWLKILPMQFTYIYEHGCI